MLDNYNIICEKWEWDKNPHSELVYDTFYLTDAYLGFPYNTTLISFQETENQKNVLRKVEIKYVDTDPTHTGRTITLNKANLHSGASCYLDSPDAINYRLTLSISNHPTSAEIAAEFNKYWFAFQATVIIDGYYSTPTALDYTGNSKTMNKPNYVEKPVIPNFFSEDERTLIETINIKDYLIDLGTLNYTFDNADDEKGINNLYFEDSDISFTCSGIKNNRYLKTFFGINEDTSYIGYMIKIYKNNTLKFKGIVNQESIEEIFSASEDSEQIKFQSLGRLKEFKNFYSNKSITIPEALLNNKEILLIDLLKYLFDSSEVNFILEPDIEEYWVTLDCKLEKLDSVTTNFRLRKCSFGTIALNGENCWCFLNKLCNDYGWVFYSDNENFYLQNRSTDVLISSTLDYNKFIEYTAIKEKYSFGFDCIVIPDGQFYGGNNSGFGDIRRASGFLIFTNKSGDTKNDIPFYQMTGSHGFGFVGGIWQKIKKIDGTNWTYQIITDDSTNHYGALEYTLDSTKILFLDGGNTSDHGWVFDTSNGVNRPQNGITDGEGGVREFDVFYTGNYGGCLFKKLSGNKWQMYYDYVKTEKFANNYLKYRQTNASNKIKVKYYGTDISPLTKFTIVNNDELSGTWTINTINYDFKLEEVEFELQKKLE